MLRDIALHLGAATLGAGVLTLLRDWDGSSPDRDLAPPPELATPDLLGVVYEALLDGDARRRDGAFYTPASLANRVAAATLGPLLDNAALAVCDPAAGGGALLLAVLRLALARGFDPHDLHLTGVDRDPLALAAAEAAVHLVAPTTPTSMVTGDALGPVIWPSPGVGRFDAVVANPPFLSQLSRVTTRSRREASRLASRFGDAAAGYTDTSSLFALLAVELVRPGGRIGLILPEPVIATRDGGHSRARIGSATTLDHLSLEPAHTFSAGVRVCVTVMERTSPTRVGERSAGDTSQDRWSRGDWASLGADAAGVPQCRVQGAGLLSDVATCTADFRDQFYGLAALAVDDATPGNALRPPLVTSGLIDVLDNGWGTRTARIAKRDFLHPRADLTRLPETDALRRWASTRLVPKVLLATQTAVLEAVPDPAGALLPMVPVVSVIPRDTTVWEVLAVLCAPPVSVIARRRAAGAALSRDAIKLSARQVAALPLPQDDLAWRQGADAARRAASASNNGDRDAWRIALDDLAGAMCAAYGVDTDAVVPWWRARVDRAALRRPGGTGRRV